MGRRLTGGDLNEVVACVVALEERIAAMSGEINRLEATIEAAGLSAIDEWGWRIHVC